MKNDVEDTKDENDWKKTNALLQEEEDLQMQMALHLSVSPQGMFSIQQIIILILITIFRTANGWVVGMCLLHPGGVAHYFFSIAVFGKWYHILLSHILSFIFY